MVEKKVDEIKVRLHPDTKVLFRAKAALERISGSQLLNYFIQLYNEDDISLYDFIEKVRNKKFITKFSTRKRLNEIRSIDQQRVSILLKDDAYKEFWDLSEDEFY